MAHDVGMHERSEVVLVVSPREPMPQPQGVEALIGLAGGLAARVVGGVEAVVGAAVGGVLDRVVPGTVGAVLDRIDLTSMVLQRVDLRRVVEQGRQRSGARGNLHRLSSPRPRRDWGRSNPALHAMVDQLLPVRVSKGLREGRFSARQNEGKVRQGAESDHCRGGKTGIACSSYDAR